MSQVNIQQVAALAASNKKAKQIVIMNLQGISSITDYFVICTANSSKQVQAVADHVEEKLKEKDILPLRREGFREARWVLLDYGDCIVHIFTEEDRTFYDLESLWSEAPTEFFTEEIAEDMP